jgi:hypothetical protein
MYICRKCKYLLLELCILCMLVYLWLLVVYLIEMAGYSPYCVTLRVPLANVCKLDWFCFYSVYVTLSGVMPQIFNTK